MVCLHDHFCDYWCYIKSIKFSTLDVPFFCFLKKEKVSEIKSVFKGYSTDIEGHLHCSTIFWNHSIQYFLNYEC